MGELTEGLLRVTCTEETEELIIGVFCTADRHSNHSQIEGTACHAPGHHLNAISHLGVTCL